MRIMYRKCLFYSKKVYCSSKNSIPVCNYRIGKQAALINYFCLTGNSIEAATEIASTLPTTMSECGEEMW